MNDFETVRAVVERDEPLSLPPHERDARAALDRIEAENTRLETERAANEQLGLWLTSEVRRLEGALKEIDRYCNTQHGMAAYARKVARAALAKEEA